MPMLFVKKIASSQQVVLLVSVIIIFILSSCGVRPVVGPIINPVGGYSGSIEEVRVVQNRVDFEENQGYSDVRDEKNQEASQNLQPNFEKLLFEDSSILVSLDITASANSNPFIGMLNLTGVGFWRLHCFFNKDGRMNCTGRNQIGVFLMTGRFTDNNSYSGLVDYTENNVSKVGDINLTRN